MKHCLIHNIYFSEDDYCWGCILDEVNQPMWDANQKDLTKEEVEPKKEENNVVKLWPSTGDKSDF